MEGRRLGLAGGRGLGGLVPVPISYHGRTYAEGKKIDWQDGLAALYHIIRTVSSTEKT